ncbi:MAG: hypothetical protein IPF82_13815 [Blastocatellia bacterium]|nr:hypothetical protein [Blastocatellia bacterium]
MSRPGETIGVRPAGLADDSTDHPETSANGPASSDRAVRLTLGILTAMLGAGLVAYVVRYGRNLFYWDDFELVPGLTGQQPTDLAWFFTWQNEHLVVMARTAFYVVWHTTEDTRVMMLLVCAGLVASTVFLLETARAARGRASWSDAAIPLLILSWGHYQNLIFPLQFFFAWSVALSCACLWAFVRARDDWRWAELAAVAVAMPLLPLNGVLGALFAAPFVFLAVRTALERALARDDCSRRDAAVLGLASVATIGTLVLNVSGYRRMAHHPPADSIVDVLSSISEVLATSIGPAGIPTWPVSGLLVAALAIAAALTVVLARRPSVASRRTIETLAASLAGFLALVCAIGYGRAGLGPTVAFASRYSIFSAALVSVALILTTVVWRGTAGRVIGIAVLVVAVSAPPARAVLGRSRIRARDSSGLGRRLLSDLANGVPIGSSRTRTGARFIRAAQALTTFFHGTRRGRKSDCPTNPRATPMRSRNTDHTPHRAHELDDVERKRCGMLWRGPLHRVRTPGARPRLCGSRQVPSRRFRTRTPISLPTRCFWAPDHGNVFDPGQSGTRPS